MSSNILGMKIKCPRCQKETEYSQENAFRPFCSKRCRDIDLGNWVEGQYAVPGEKVDIPTPDVAHSQSEESEE